MAKKLEKIGGHVQIAESGVYDFLFPSYAIYIEDINDRIFFYRVKNKKQLGLRKGYAFGELVDNTDSPFADHQALVDYVKGITGS